jgi:hypothetical protein
MTAGELGSARLILRRWREADLSVPEGHRLRRHVLYRLKAADWKSAHQPTRLTP